MLSPLNVDVCLTEPSPACDRTEPDKYYPTGTRNYARLAPNLIYQSAALAQLAQRLGLRRVFVLADREAYGVGIASHFRRAARQLGIGVVGSRSWDPDDPSTRRCSATSPAATPTRSCSRGWRRRTGPG